MDTAVQWVQAYLQMNGYFTVAEYQVVEELGDGTFRTATDLDIMAVRFPGAGRLVPAKGEPDRLVAITDPVLDVAEDRIDLIIGEVKEGAATVNPAGRDHGVLRSALARFGAAAHEEAGSLVSELLEGGEAISDRGFRVRMMAFGTKPPRKAHPFTIIGLGHIGRFVQAAVTEHWDVAAATRFPDPVLGSIVLMEKAKRAAEFD
jgi:hypothetical protein